MQIYIQFGIYKSKSPVNGSGGNTKISVHVHGNLGAHIEFHLNSQNIAGLMFRNYCKSGRKKIVLPNTSLTCGYADSLNPSLVVLGMDKEPFLILGSVIDEYRLRQG